ncbi:uncharacterized protein JCM6883_004358 [Sporobolomyces salmoneus]|uniref:uncharacterized protein n=1 Tax=Sporobolomyces salmoneus TaxID=183962 RepID=UPI0031828D2A
MSLRSQRPQNAPPPGEGGGGLYSNNNSNNYRPPAPSSQQSGSSMPPPVPSTNQTSSSSAPSGSSSSSSSKPPPLTLEQSRQVARTHFDALKSWLTREGALATATTRTNARDKLTRLTRQQFQELSTDVYDELVRRIEDAAGRPGEQPFLAVRPDFHPKRNQARQKLATLPLQRFKDLASDVYFELDRRYPEFGEEDQQRENSRAPSRSDSLSSSHNRHNAPSPTPPPNLNAQRRAPTPNQQPRSPIDHIPPPLSAPSSSGAPTSTANEVVVPNKSTMVVEEPSGNFTTQSQSSQTSRVKSPPPPASSSASQTRSSDYQQSEPQQRSSPTDSQPPRRDELSPLQNQQPNFGSTGGGPFRGGQGHQSRISEVSSVGTHSKFFGGYAGSATGTPSESGGRRSNELPPWDHEERQALEKQKSDYEYKLTVLQNRVQELERENEDAVTALRGRNNTEQERLREFEGQLRNQQQRYDDQTSQLRMVQRDFDSLQQRHQQVQRERDQHQQSLLANGRGGTGGEEEMERMRQDLGAAEDLANELRGEVSSLVDELRQVNERCEDLQLELDKERRDKEEKEREARDWKEKWQSAKTELRNIKATSQLFTSTINVERDYMPASSDGLINDTSIAAFQTSIDDLLEAARSKEPSSVISHARQVVSAVEKIDLDVQAISPSRYNSLSLQDQDIVNSLKAKINATLSNLMTASKNHATSFGVSPVSLLDAAASHLASTIVELVRILKIRRTTGQPTRSGSLDPSTTSSSRFNNREPMPSLAEDSSYHRTAPSSSSLSSPPTQTREVPSSLSTSPPTATKSNGYVSGGVSSLVSSSTAGVRNALEAMGIASSSSAASRSSLEKDRDSSSIPEPPQRRYDEQPISSPQSDYGAQSQPGYNSFQQSNSYGSSQYNDQSSANNNEDQRFNQYGQAEQYRSRDSYDDQRQQHQYDGYSQQQQGNDMQDYGSPGMRGHETNVDELKSYIENQTEAIVHSIQSLLSAIRSGSQGEQLNENLTQIITIVSSIVAISKDALPRTGTSGEEGESILNDLTNHCDKLSEMQSETSQGGLQSFTKQTKQQMATASFGVAKSLKQLNGLFARNNSSSNGDANEEGLV